MALRAEKAPFDADDWLGPWRGYIGVMAKGPAGRAVLAAAGFPPEEIPPAPPRVLVRPKDLQGLGV